MTQYIIGHWAQLKPDLNGKLRISVGNEDTYYLNLPVMLMEKEMKKPGANMPFAYYPGTHFTVATPDYRKAEIMRLKQMYLRWLAQHLAAQPLLLHTDILIIMYHTH
ncbi:hypothetical protein [Hymenobacter cavernae]|uniref:Uncharacterized protein n=1 Tax=Hymenobacter cavernae TaxID=2044852 RepID=A0ABQ1UBY6_9BACT|nr:hypothetical protein [Hymenobacter cavernae]GGF15419.1 hypothetical protein GCM10011383_28390 [Hymenobacter cavernae]